MTDRHRELGFRFIERDVSRAMKLHGAPGVKTAVRDARRRNHSAVTVKFLDAKLRPPGDDVISKPYWSSPIVTSSK